MMNKTLIMLVTLLSAHAAFAAPAFTGQDYSGVYDCTGNDSHEGPYKGTVTMTLDRKQSTGNYGAYQFKLEVPGFGTYLGQAAAEGDKVAMYFALTDPKTRDYGTGIATMKKDKSGRWSFHKYYYEPEFKGGNYGMEDCVLRK
jgi:hypothetical protein